MAKILANVDCPVCGSDAEIRARGGVSRAMDLKCASCGQLPFQTKEGQARLQSMLDKLTPSQTEPDPMQDESGDTPEKKTSESGFLTLMG